MKTTLKLLITTLVLLGGLSSCKKDLGSYDYTTVDSLKIEGIEDVYIVKYGDTFSLTPRTSFLSNKTFRADDYTYEWFAFKQGVDLDQPKIEISDQQVLDGALPLGIGEYNMYYRIREKSTNITWTSKFLVRVSASYNGGWMILSDDNGKSRLDFFEYDHATFSYPTVHRNFQEKIRSAETAELMPLEGRPAFLASWNNAVSGISVSPLYYMYVGTDVTTQKINMTNGAIWDEKYPFKFETDFPPLFETIDKIYPTAPSDAYIIKGTDAYVRVRVMGLTIGVPLNRLADGTHFRVAPYVAAFPNFQGAGVFYDIDNKRFVRNSGWSRQSTSPLTYNANSAFNPNDVGMDLVWMDQTAALGGLAYAVLTKDNKYYLARMNNNASGFSARFWDEITALPEIANADFFEVDQRYGYLQYAVGGKIYQYDPDEKTTKLMKDYGSRKISFFQYCRNTTVSSLYVNVYPDTYGKRFEPATYGLVCATYDPASPDTSGKVDVLKVPQFSAAFETYLTFDGFGKVVGVREAEHPLGW